MFDAISGLFCFSSKVCKANPDQHGASNMVTLDARLSTLVLFDAGELFDFPVKLLNFPTHATHLLCGMQRILSQVVGYYPIRAICGHLDPKQFHLGTSIMPMV